MLAASLVFIWFTITLYSSQKTEFHKLKVNAGAISKAHVVITKIKNTPFYKDTTREMRFFLDDSLNYFLITTTGNLNYFDSLFIGDTVKIYTRDKVWGIFGFNERLILHLERISDNKVFLRYSETQRSNRDLYLLTGIFSIGLFIWYLVRVKKRVYWDSD
jgi:hypothetical protein